MSTCTECAGEKWIVFGIAAAAFSKRCRLYPASFKYQQKREAGMSHACALRCLGQRLLKILFRMICTKKPYDAELHARNQQKHGSWVLKLLKESAA